MTPAPHASPTGTATQEKLSGVIPFWRHSEVRAGLALVLAIYGLINCAMLIYGDFVPYVLDNNESFSTLNHAKNLIEFGIDESFGLADEAVGPSPDAHPFPHTHQGNMPRLFASLLYGLGVQSIESQISITSFTVGLAGVIMAFCFFVVCAGPRFATLACVVLITDYIFFVQWQVNTYRVWAYTLLFANLLCAEYYAQSRSWPWLLAIWFSAVALFYYEFAFVSFVATTTALYLAWRLRENWRHLLLGWTAMGLGAAISLTVLALQVIGYLGWQDAITDFKLTFAARTYSDLAANASQVLQDFYGERNIAFFYNVAASRSDDVLHHFWPAFVAAHLQIVTPFIAMLLVIALAGYATRLGVEWAVAKYGGVEWLRPYRAAALCAVSFGLGVLFFQLFWLSDFWSLRVIADGALASILLAVIVAVAVVVTAYYAHRSIGRLCRDQSDGAAALRLMAGVFFLTSALCWSVLESNLYDATMRELWLDALAPPGRSLIQAIGLISIITIWLAAIITPRATSIGTPATERLVCFFGASAFAAIVTGNLFSGYVWSGYLDRGETYLAPQLAAAIAFAALATLHIASSFLQRSKALAYAERSSGWARDLGRLLRGSGLFGFIALAAMSLHWIWAQGAYAMLLPPNQLAWAEKLRGEALLGHSVVSNTYPVPFGLATGEWAYMDTLLASGSYLETAAGYEPLFGKRTLWLADAKTNPRYSRPDLFVCFVAPSLRRIANQLAGREELGCRDIGIVKAAMASGWRAYPHELIAIDSAELDAWAILRLNWTPPPFLTPMSSVSEDAFVGVRIKNGERGGHVVSVDYGYAHQLGESEADSVVRVYRLKVSDQLCGNQFVTPADVNALDLVAEAKGVRKLALPATVRGQIVVSVRPVTSRRSGREYFSELIDLEGAHDDC